MTKKLRNTSQPRKPSRQRPTTVLDFLDQKIADLSVVDAQGKGALEELNEVPQGVDKIDRLTRDEVLTLARSGVLTGEQADAWAERRGQARFSMEPNRPTTIR